MALADGTSKIVCHDISLHAQTMVELLKMYIPDLDIKVEAIDEEKNSLITIKGIGYNPY